MSDNKLALAAAASTGFAIAAEAFPGEIASAFATADALRRAIVRPTDAAVEPVTTYRVAKDATVAS